jgi:hypothetical protein
MFQVGDEVVCINAKPIDVGKIPPPLVQGKHYVIEDVAGDMVDVGLKTSTGDPWYLAASRFAPITSIEDILSLAMAEEEEFELETF